MSEKINYLWRLLGTAMSFALFGVGGLCLALFCFPLVRLFSTESQRVRRVQRILRWSYRIFLGFMERMGVCTVRVEGAEKLQQGAHLIVANHPSLLDVVLILSVVPEADCIVKAKAWKNPFFRGVLEAAGYIRNDDSIELIGACVERLRAGRSLLIFPEGTRSLPGKLQKLKRGAAAIAVQSGATLTPVLVTCTPSTLTKAERWYEIPSRRFELAMVVGDPIDVAQLTQGCRNHLLAYRKLTRYLQNYFLSTGYYDGCVGT